MELWEYMVLPFDDNRVRHSLIRLEFACGMEVAGPRLTDIRRTRLVIATTEKEPRG